MSTLNLAFVQQNMTIEMTQQKCIVTNSNDKEIKRHWQSIQAPLLCQIYCFLSLPPTPHTPNYLQCTLNCDIPYIRNS